MMGATKSKVPWCKRVTKHVIYEPLAEVLIRTEQENETFMS
ncbi:hypothetical protein HanXRQr2_Chr10g0455771 [Helianthus annuus]|uniref:Uncharacterized protein n=1 Tax=Helianthus annuus TaxID=4232 RepID=A0A9K3I0P5_HELAN|nr:hypothetical protein HanXRQr2_Chr10g0455771 [Helianthus annuus]KAJ0884990.1 hypothetical protein HanPSC8_Chr10g0440231 [Helianthus annuus]